MSINSALTDSTHSLIYPTVSSCSLKLDTQIKLVGLPQKLSIWGNFQKSKNYGYIIFPPNDPTQSVLMVAKPFRPDLKMYSSGVFVTKNQDKSFTVAGVCETIKSVAIPGMPKYSNKGKSPIECPAGYQLVK